MTVQTALPHGVPEVSARERPPLHDPVTRVEAAVLACRQQPHLGQVAASVVRHLALLDGRTAAIRCISRRLADDLAMSPRTLRRALAKLSAAGLIVHEWTTHETTISCLFLRDGDGGGGADSVTPPSGDGGGGADSVTGPRRERELRSERESLYGADFQDRRTTVSLDRLHSWLPSPIPGLSASTTALAASAFRADVIRRVLRDVNDPNGVHFRSVRGVDAYWRKWQEHPSYAPGWPVIAALEPHRRTVPASESRNPALVAERQRQSAAPKPLPTEPLPPSTPEEQAICARVWPRVLDQLTDVDQFDTWLKPLQAEVRGGKLVLWALNRYAKDAVEGLFLERIERLASADVRGVEVWIVAGDRTAAL